MSVGGQSRRSTGRNPQNYPASTPSIKGKDRALVGPFEPCAATASLFLFSQGSQVLCLHHDTLALERRFSQHNQDIQFISVDNVSERGAGRLVVTYDYGQTAIVWDLFTGEQVARFASYEAVRVAAWMRNGNIAFGNVKGEVILFEPATSEHVSARTIFDPITALAPSADCKTYAIGYNNGSILLAGLTPSFTILHTLTTSRAPSPIATLSWHASSSKQRSDMLATQTSDGDLRVWSVGKPPSSETPRVIRVLRRSERFLAGRNWISWSKSGRIVQFSEGETWSWDVRTKNVTYEPVPTIEHVQGIAAYGPTATLFTIGQGFTIQQYDLDRAQMVANIRYLPTSVPATPFEEDKALGHSTSEEDQVSPVQRAGSDVIALESSRGARARFGRPGSNLGDHSNSTGSHDSGLNNYYQEVVSPESQMEPSLTTFSIGSAPTLRESRYHPTAKSIRSATSTKSKSNLKSSRLRQEILPSPADKESIDLFPYIRARLSDVPYKPPRMLGDPSLTSDELRKQMLSVVFGWEEDIRDLIRDELSRHPVGSRNAAYLSRWLNDDPDHLAALISANQSAPEVDWMLLAFNGISPRSNRKIADAFVEKMLVQNEAHAAATILYALGDRNDAIEVYVSRNYFMEAILLACLAMPHDWQRQSHLVRQWGEHVVKNSQQQLAIRCFSCTGAEPSEQWTSPISLFGSPTSHFGGTFEARSPGPNLNVPQITAPSRPYRDAPTPVAMPAPPTPLRDALKTGSRMTTKSSALKLITSFGPNPTYQFPGLIAQEGRTPTNANVTPIAESAIARSAISPIGGGSSYRLSNMRSLGSVLSARPGAAGAHRHRLPSIGETPVDVTPPTFPLPKHDQTPSEGSNSRSEDPTPNQQRPTAENPPALILTSARYDPNSNTVKETPLTAVAPQTAINTEPSEPFPFSITAPTPRAGPPAPLNASAANVEQQDETRSRNESRSRKPEGLSIQMLSVQETASNDSGNENYAKGSSIRRPNTAGSTAASYLDSMGDLTSPPTTGNSMRSAKSPSVTGKSLDKYISSLEEAQYYNQLQRSRTPQSMRNRSREDLADRSSRSRHGRQMQDGSTEQEVKTIPRSKRSPSSPIPMSPADLRLYTASVESFASAYQSQGSATDGVRAARRRGSSHRSRSRTGGKQRQRSYSKHEESLNRGSERMVSDPQAGSQNRGRSKSRRSDSSADSPASPLPMLPSEEDRQKYNDIDPALRLVAQAREMRHRSGSRKDDLFSRDTSQEPRRNTGRSISRRASDASAGFTGRDNVALRKDREPSRRQADDNVNSSQNFEESLPSTTYEPSATPDPGNISSSNQQLVDRRRKEIAAAELEARRLSLANRPSVPSIPHPSQYSGHAKSASMGIDRPASRGHLDTSSTNQNGAPNGMNSLHSPLLEQIPSDSSSSGMGKRQKNSRGTPRAMPYPSQTQDPAIPDIPDHIETLLSKDVYRPVANGIGMSTSAPIDNYGNHDDPSVELPKHPAFDQRITASRSSSKNRDNHLAPRAPSRERATSRDRGRPSTNDGPLNVGYRDNRPNGTSNVHPPILPELQHLASPPPPPPPPLQLRPSTAAAPFYNFATNLQISQADSENQNSSKLSIRTDVSQVPMPPVPKSAISEATLSASPNTHRRGRSGNDNNFIGKVRNIAGRMRSSSRGRDNATRSPNQSSDTVSPYETIVPPGATILPHTSPPIPQSADFGRGRDNAARHANQGPEAFSPYESIIPPNATVHPHMSPALG